MIDDGEVGVDLTIDGNIRRGRWCRLCMHWALRSGNGDIDLDVDSIRHHPWLFSIPKDVRLISKLNRCMFVVDSDPTPQNVATLTNLCIRRAIVGGVEAGRVRTKTYCHAPSVQDAKLSAGINRLESILASGSPTLHRAHQYQQLAPYRLQ
jgi:hypothetical protein